LLGSKPGSSSLSAFTSLPSLTGYLGHVAKISHDLVKASGGEQQGLEWYSSRGKVGTIYSMAGAFLPCKSTRRWTDLLRSRAAHAVTVTRECVREDRFDRPAGRYPHRAIRSGGEASTRRGDVCRLDRQELDGARQECGILREGDVVIDAFSRTLPVACPFHLSISLAERGGP
jgi:hypothetical protein